MQRDEWVFEYTAKVLAEAAEKQREFRKSRVVWWTDQKASVMAEIKESGIEVEESVAARYGMSDKANYTTAGAGPQVVVRTDLQRKLTECHQKIERHQAGSRDYDGWVRVLNANPEARLKLEHDDWLYFFGK